MKSLEDIILEVDEKRTEKANTIKQIDKLAGKQIRLEEEIEELLDSLKGLVENK
jgi:hypothetical protein